MDPRKIIQRILQDKPTGHLDIGRPRRRLEDDLETEQAVMAYLEDDDDDSVNAYIHIYNIRL
jgi:hypothetical protein